MIRGCLDCSTVLSTASCHIYSRLDYCDSIFSNLPASQLIDLYLDLNASARAVNKRPKLCCVSTDVKSLHWLNVIECINLKYFF